MREKNKRIFGHKNDHRLQLVINYVVELFTEELENSRDSLRYLSIKIQTHKKKQAVNCVLHNDHDGLG